MEGKQQSGATPHFSIGKVDVSTWRMLHPLSVDGCLILLCEEGEIEITTNSRCRMMCAGDMALLVFDMVSVPVKISDDFHAKYIALDFASAQDIFFLVTSNRFWEYIYTYTVFTLSKHEQSIARQWFGLIESAYDNCSAAIVDKVLRNEIENFMMIMAEYVEAHFGVLGTNPSKNRAWAIANEFLGLLTRYYTHHHDVAFYAGKLNISPNYLNIVAKRILGISAKEQINKQLVVLIKMLLDTTDLTVKEVAEKLHYDDPSYLCRVFRTHTGLSPIQYRNQHRQHHPDNN